MLSVSVCFIGCIIFFIECGVVVVIMLFVGDVL